MYKLAFIIISVFIQRNMAKTCAFPQSTYTQPIDFNALQGNWNQIYRLPNSLIDKGNCSSISINAGSKTFTIRTVDAGKEVITSGTYNYLNSTDKPARFDLTMNDRSYDMMLVATNYTGYAFMYSCSQVTNDTISAWGWALSRQTSYSDEQLTYLLALISMNSDLSSLISNIENIDHSKTSCNASSALKVSSFLVLLTVFFVGNKM